MTLEAVKEYLRIDSDEEEDKLIAQMMKAAESYIINAVGEYDDQNAKANLLYMALVQDLYDNRMLMVTEQQRRRMSYTYASIILQLQYQTKEGAAGELIQGG